MTTRFGAESRLNGRFTILLEGEGVFYLDDNSDDIIETLPSIPNLVDPGLLELNRAQLQAKLGPQSYLTIGRQRLAIDDQRFIGRAAFRQNEQTFDGVHLSARTQQGITIQTGYFARVNPALGEDEDFGSFRGDSYYFNANLPSPIGRLGLFHYALDLETGPRDNPTDHFSNQTTGFRYDGRWHADTFGLDIEGSYARQTEFANNPIVFDVNYWLAGAKVFAGPFRAGFRVESLGSDGETGEAFQAFAGSRHRFQGDADIFVITPKNGLRDTEVSATWAVGRIGPLSGVTASARYHWFNAILNQADHGRELDLTISAGWRGFKTGLVFADYDAEFFAEDTQRLYLSLSRDF